MGGKKTERADAKAERADGKKGEVAALSKKAEEDAYFGDEKGGKGGKGAKKKEDEEAKKADKAAAAASKKAALEAEEAEMVAKPKASKTGGKVTHVQLAIQREIEAKAREAAIAEKGMQARREVDEAAYAALVSHENVNKAAAEQGAATSIEEALSVLGMKEKEEKHPEKRMKVAWKEYEEANIPIMKEDKPGLKMSQYREMVWKAWQKAPENPMNQAAAAAPK
ncbi:hypothetical protein FOA52_012370 [Chlamydomonas sp. UWO 241]|nr:hypothetical protein FOA52_012370 [Chlamydomonas sp. UWO 241]